MTGAAPAPPRAHSAIIAAAIIIATFLASLPAIRSGFIWDDDVHVTKNVTLRSLAGLELIWLRPGATPQYYPLTHTTFWLEWHLWHVDPLGYHVVNVALHASSALLLWRVLALLGLGRAAPLAAAIFALHPIEVESVAWITERKNVLSGVFYFASALAFLKSDKPGSYALAVVLFICAVLSKTVAGTLPAALLLMIWWKTGRIRRRDALRVLPMFVIALVMGIVTARMERQTVGAAGPEWAFTFLERCLIAVRALWFYAYKLLVPINLTFIYPRWTINPHNPLQWMFVLSAIAVVAALFALRNRLGRGPLAAVLFFVGTLMPALGFVNTYPMRYSFVADHFQYLAGIGIIVPGAVGAAWILGQCADLAWVIPAILGLLTFRQCQMYHDVQSALGNDARAKSGRVDRPGSSGRDGARRRRS